LRAPNRVFELVFELVLDLVHSQNGLLLVDWLFIAWLLVVHCRSHAPALMLPLSCSRSHAPALMLQHLLTSYPNRVFELVLSPRTKLT
jgi:hypothetical protein